MCKIHCKFIEIKLNFAKIYTCTVNLLLIYNICIKKILVSEGLECYKLLQFGTF